MVEPTQEQQDQYTLLLGVLDVIMNKLKHGNNQLF